MKMCPFEFTATPATSPRFMSAGSFDGSATDSNGSSGAEGLGAACCAATVATNATETPATRKRAARCRVMRRILPHWD